MKRQILNIVLLFCVVSIAGCRLDLEVLGDGVVAVTDDSDGSLVFSCADTCSDKLSPIEIKDVTIAPTANPGSAFVTFLMNGEVSPGPVSTYYGLYFSVERDRFIHVSQDVKAIFHDDQDLLAVKRSGSIACMLSVIEGLVCWGSEEQGLQQRVKDIPPEFKFADDFIVVREDVCAVVGMQVACWGTHEIDLTHLNNVSEIAAGHQTACVINGNEVVCWEGGELQSNVPALVNPTDLRIDGYTVCIDDNAEEVCWR